MMAASLTVGSSSIGKDTCLQVSAIECILRYRKFDTVEGEKCLYEL